MAESIQDILKKVRRVQITARRTVNDLLAGQYRSVFRGQGMEFDEVREYQPGDEIRTIDWNVTARAGTPFIKRYSEERELTVLFVVDVSASGIFGSRSSSRLNVIVELAAVLMFSALRNNDRVGLLTFADGVESWFAPRKGKSHVLRLLRELLSVTPVKTGTNIDHALKTINTVQRRNAVVFLMSDFLDQVSRSTLIATHGRHDLVSVCVQDPREHQLPESGILNLRDAETGQVMQVDAGNAKVRKQFADQAMNRRLKLKNLLQQAGTDLLEIDLAESYITSLQRFFTMRERRKRA
ncbi:MAG: DUF58 domain-containing protein [Fuerstiella sp.]